MENRWFITGDTHGDLSRIFDFVERFELKENINFLILGDAGVVWKKDKKDLLNTIKELDEFNQKHNLNIYFIPGNHENFDLLDSMDRDEQTNLVYISKHLIYIPKGTVLDLPIGKCLCVGGADSVDKMFRIEHLSWWPQEQITPEDIEKIPEGHYDYLFTHCTNWDTCNNFGFILYTINNITEESRIHVSEKLLNELNKKITYNKNYFGHYHVNKQLDEKHQCLFDDIIELEVKN